MSLYSLPKLLRSFTRKASDLPNMKNPKPVAQKLRKLKSKQESVESQDPLSLEFQKFVMNQMRKEEEGGTVGMNEKIKANEKLSKITKAIVSGEVLDLDQLDQSAFKEFEEIEKEFGGDEEKEMSEALSSVLKDVENVQNKED